MAEPAFGGSRAGVAARFSWLVLAAAVAAALHGLMVIPLVSSHTSTDSGTYLANAESLRHGHYSAPAYRHGPLVPSASRTPGYPLFLAALGGGGVGVSRNLVLVGQALLLGVSTWLLALTLRRLWRPEVAVLGAWLYALDPYSKRFVTVILTEGLAPLVFAAAVLALVVALQERSFAAWAASGALASALTLVRPFFVLGVPVVVLAALIHGRLSRRAVACATVAASCAALVLGPWLARNASLVGKPVLTTWGNGVNLLLAAQGERLHGSVPEARSSEFAARRSEVAELAATPAEIRRDPNAFVRAQLRQDEYLRRAGLSVYRQRLEREPFQVASEWLGRAYFLWQAHADKVQYQAHGVVLWALRIVDWLVLAIALAGAFLALRLSGMGRIVLLLLSLYTGASAVFHVNPRFSDPVRGLFLGFVALALVESFSLLRRVRQRPGSRSRDRDHKVPVERLSSSNA